MAEQDRTWHRAVYRLVAVCSVAAIVWGGVVAYAGYQQTAGPDGAVKGYFAALARGDAPAALGFGALPAGPHTLLTSTVLRLQQRIAPIRDVRVASTQRRGGTAIVTVRYRLGFREGARQALDRVRVIRRGGVWRLAQTAASTSLDLTGALERATVDGAGIPAGTVSIFPGALPITFDTRYLRLDPRTSSVALSAPPDTTVSVEVSSAGRSVIVAAVTKALTACFGAGKADPRCPLPSDRVVPGSMRGTLSRGALARISLAVRADQAGVVAISGHDVTVQASYQELDFNNQPSARSGAVTFEVAATTYAVAPIRLNWANPS